jgi:hypothetical protein
MPKLGALSADTRQDFTQIKNPAARATTVKTVHTNQK